MNPIVDMHLDAEKIKTYANRFNLLQKKVNIDILRIIGKKKEVRTTDLCKYIKGLSPSRSSQHLNVLKKASLVTVRKEGRNRIYSINVKVFTKIEYLLKSI